MSPNNLFFVTGFFPPDAAVGAIRTGEFARRLSSDFKWNVTVVRPKCSTHDSEPPALSSCHIVETHAPEMLWMVRRFRRFFPKKVSSNGPANTPASNEFTGNGKAGRQRNLLARLSDLLAVPDSRRGWIRPASRALQREVMRTAGKKVLLSSGPPHSAHVAAARVKRRTHVPWVADLRDPWGGNPYALELSSIARRANDRLERETLMCADAIVCNTEAACELIAKRLPKIPKDRLLCIPNGYDENDFVNLTPRPIWKDASRVTFLHTGSLYAKRTPAALLEAWCQLRSYVTNRMPHLVFLGNCEPHLESLINAAIEQVKPVGKISLVAPVPRHQALCAAMAADGLVLLGDSCEPQVQVPAKVYEYLRLNKPILVLFPETSPVRNLVRSYASHFAFANPNNPEEIANAVKALLSDATSDLTNCSPKSDVRDLSRARQAEALHNLLLNVVSAAS